MCACSLLSFAEQYLEYDPFFTTPEPSNPWISDDVTSWELEAWFWLAVQELKKRPIREVPTRVQEIWEEFLAPGAPSAINVDSRSYDKTTQNIKDPGRYAFQDAFPHYSAHGAASRPRLLKRGCFVLASGAHLTS
ncbi:hypothetical protein cypCar_00047863 [Cyprinus carpio]|nr:hypothetical protein cypCar_00047863 [Cyprinus carpio]